MPAFCTVVQYLPDPLTEERINIGVIVYGDGVVRSRFLTDWTRVRQFSTGRDISFLRELAAEFQDAHLKPPIPQFIEAGMAVDINERLIQRMARSWSNSIQLTEPKGSLLGVDELLDDSAAHYLHERSRERRHYRDKQEAVRITRRALEQALKREFQDDVAVNPANLLHSRFPINGRYEQHFFDLALANGQAIAGSLGVSFQVHDPSNLERNLSVAKWTVIDVRQEHPNLPLAIVTLPPSRHSKMYDDLVSTAVQLRSEVVPEGEVNRWAQRMAERAKAEAH